MSKRQGYRHLVAYVFIFIAFSLWPAPSLPACSPQQAEAAQVKPMVKADEEDPFYRKLYEDGLEEHMATAAPSETLLKRFREVQGKFQKAPKPPKK